MTAKPMFKLLLLVLGALVLAGPATRSNRT